MRNVTCGRCLCHKWHDSSKYDLCLHSLCGSVHNAWQSPHVLAALADCTFTDWTGFASPLNIAFQSIGSVRNSTFRNMHLQSEIADVSFNGTAHFEDVRFANVTLKHGFVIGTTLNDDQQATGDYIQYNGDDEAVHSDMTLSPVKEVDSGVLGVELVIENDAVSDCTFMHAAEDVLGRPGCSAAAAITANRRLGGAGESGSAASPAGDECEIYSVTRGCR